MASTALDISSSFINTCELPLRQPSPSTETLTSVIQSIDNLMKGYSAALSPISERPLLESSLPNPTLVMKALAVLRDHLALIGASLGVVLSIVGLILFPFLSPLFAVSLTLGVAGIVIGIDLSLGGRHIFKSCGSIKQAEARQLLCLQLKNLGYLTPDQLWQLRRHSTDNDAFRAHLAAVLDLLETEGALTKEEKEECLSALVFPSFGVYDNILRYLNFKGACHRSGESERISLKHYLHPDSSAKQVIHKAALYILKDYGVSEVLFQRWLAPLKELQSYALSAEWEERLHEFHTQFILWLNEQRQGGALTEKESLKLTKEFHELLLTLDVETLSEAQAPSPSEKIKKKVWVVISKGGGAHLSCSAAIEEALAKDPQIEWSLKDINLLRDILTPLDPIYQISQIFGSAFNSEDLFNKLISSDSRLLTSWLISYGEYSVLKGQSKITALMRQYLAMAKTAHEAPDVLISNIPLFNGALAAAAAKEEIPFVVLPADMKSNYYGAGLSFPSHSNFRVGLAYNDYNLMEGSDWVKANLRPGQLVVTGFPLKSAFSEPKTKEEAFRNLTALNIPQDKVIITLRMGGQGSTAILEYLRAFKNGRETNWHMIILCGRSKDALLPKIQDIFPDLESENRAITVVGFTNQVSDILCITDVDLTKTGSASVAESWMRASATLLDPPGIKGERDNVHLTADQRSECVVLKKNDLGTMIRAAIKSANEPASPRLQAVRRQFALFHRHLQKTLRQSMGMS